MIQAPQNIEAEKSLLGAFLLDPDSLLIAVDIVGSSDLYKESHRVIFNAALDLYQIGTRLDIVTLSERLREQRKLEQAGGISYLTELAGCTPTSANVKYHARIIKSKAIMRRAIRWAADVSKQASEGVEDVKAWIGEIEKSLIDLSQGIGENKDPYAGSVISAIRTSWKELREGKKTFTPTDSKFNAVIPGYFPKHFWVIGGYTSNGKSSLLNQILVDVCYEGMRPLIFSLEDSREEKMMKMISNLSDISQTRLITGDIEGLDKGIFKAEETIKGWNPILYDDAYNIEDIRLKSKKHKLQDNINMVCIDYVQNLHGTGNLYEDMRAASIMLDRLKKELDVTVIALSQVTNESAKTNSELIGLKGAGELASAADIVLWVKRVKGEGKEHHLDCEIRKNRPFGATGIVPLMFSENWTQIDKRGF
jgi:replicative DNA helicase